MKKYYLFAGLALLATSPAFAQTKIGAAGAPDPSAMLEVTSGTASNKGLLLPKMTTAQRNAIVSPANGLMIYNTTANEVQVNTGTPASPTWAAATAATGWTTTGNTGTTPATNFIGTTDNQPLSIRTNNTEKIHVTAAGSVGIGTATPAAKLHISDTTDVAIRLAASAGNRMSVNFGNPSHGVARNLANSGGLGNDVALYTSSGPTSATEGTLYLASNPISSDSIPLTQFALKKNGNIGIGTNTPSAKLHVNNGNITISNDGPVAGSAINVISDNGGGLNPDNVSITAYGPANPIFGVSVARGTLAAPQNSQAGDNTGSLYFAPRVNGAFAALSGITSRYLGDGTTNKSSLLFITSDTLAMTIDSSGFVGIGVIPQQTLDVAGTARITGSTGIPTTITGRNAAGDLGNIALGTGLSITAGTLNATAGGNNWGLTGNNGSNPATNFIGTTDAQPLIVRTNNTEKVRVTAAGSIGIGTNAPVAKLHVVDTGNTAIVVGSSTIGTSSVNLGNGHHGMSRNLTYAGGGPNDVALFTTSGSPSSPASIHLGVRATVADTLDLNQFVLKNNGYVGIGTNTPVAKLHISDTTDVAIRLAASSGKRMGIEFGNNWHGVARNLASSGGLGNDVALYTSSGPTAATEGTLYLASNPIANDSIPLTQFALKKNGNIGIGTNTPASKLHVNDGNITILNDGPVSGSAINVISDNGGALNPDNVSITAYGPANPIFGVSVARGTLAAPQNSQAGDNMGQVAFAARINGDFSPISAISSAYLGDGTTGKSRLAFTTSGVNAMVIDSNSYVGIGTAAPAYKLHVVGDINASANVRANGVALTSDARLKRNINETKHGLSTVLALRPVEYEKKNSIKDNEYNRHEIGFIAQEVAKVLPSLVTEGKDADKTLAVSYTELIPVLTKAIQEQQAQIEALKAKNEQLEAANKVTAQLAERVKQMEQMIGIKEIEGTSKVAGK